MHDFAVTIGPRDLHSSARSSSASRTCRERGGEFSWEPARGTRLGVMPRSGGNADVRWFDTDPCYVFHPMNAYDDGDAIVLDVARYGRLDFMTPKASTN
jgi:carotenoid cleavage dioxygenase-like enzyme